MIISLYLNSLKSIFPNNYNPNNPVVILLSTSTCINARLSQHLAEVRARGHNSSVYINAWTTFSIKRVNRKFQISYAFWV